MSSHTDVLISIKPKYAACIFSGEKTVELRKRKPNIPVGAKIWIYATAPVSALKGSAILDQVISASPSEIWTKFGQRTGVSKQEFDDYFSGRKAAHALFLSQVKILETPLLLDHMKKLVQGFHPPQFFCRLNGAVAELRLNSRKYCAA